MGVWDATLYVQRNSMSDKTWSSQYSSRKESLFVYDLWKSQVGLHNIYSEHTIYTSNTIYTANTIYIQRTNLVGKRNVVVLMEQVCTYFLQKSTQSINATMCWFVVKQISITITPGLDSNSTMIWMVYLCYVTKTQTRRCEASALRGHQHAWWMVFGVVHQTELIFH